MADVVLNGRVYDDDGQLMERQEWDFDEDRELTSLVQKVEEMKETDKEFQAILKKSGLYTTPEEDEAALEELNQLVEQANDFFDEQIRARTEYDRDYAREEACGEYDDYYEIKEPVDPQELDYDELDELFYEQDNYIQNKYGEWVPFSA